MTENRKPAALALPQSIYKNRRLVANLARNDFHAKFAGSYLGIIWAFVQPVITVLLYWFVFEKALHAGTQQTKAGITVPYVLWLMAGLIPWFYFQDVLSNGTNVLVEYSYLVKKVVFDVSLLPVVKVISAIFVHLFFIAFMLVIYCFYGMWPDIYTIQLVYYSLAMILMAMSLIYLTSALVVFFRDLSQIVGIMLQVLVWMTPIMWNAEGMQLGGTLMFILKLNPMFYIVQGYRDSLISKIWFFERPGITIYFWLFTLAVYTLGTSVFHRLRVHFADVL